MYSPFEPYRRALSGVGPILFRHVFVLVNAIIFAVVGLLIYFHEAQAGIFLGIIVGINILLGAGQDFRARVSLEKLQLLTALRVTRIRSDGGEESVLAEAVHKGDSIKLKPGDQVPCDGVLTSSRGFEVSEALITGESDSFPKKEGDIVSGGNIVTAGVGEMRVEKEFAESRIAKMTEDIKRYSLNPSPIQIAVGKVVAYSGYVLVAMIAFVIIRGMMTGVESLEVVNNIGALAASIVPQGLVVVTTLLFAFGAASYSKQEVLFQEINATEKMGRIKNLCMDKTGTLTENALTVEHIETPSGRTTEEAERLVGAYTKGSGDTSQTICAVKEFITHDFDGKTADVLAFSSWRQYGAVALPDVDGGTVVYVGSPDTFLPYVGNKEDAEWMKKMIDGHAREGKRVLAVACMQSADPSATLSGTPLALVGAFIFKNNFRQGAEDAVKFFQERGAHIRILSGDNIETVRTVAHAAGIAGVDKAITGSELEKWGDGEYKKHAHEYTIFARVKPEQKVKIIEALKLDGFTAMIGDGANDALAIKRADLGIAMFDGAAATRQIAAVVLTNNSFTALPGGVTLADNFIQNIELFASNFIYQSFIGFFLFLALAIAGYPYPLTPLTVTLLNYITVGLPGMLISYWAVSPQGKVLPAGTKSFLSRIIPFTFFSSLLGALGATLIFFLSADVFKLSASNTLVVCAFAAFGYVFFVSAPHVFRGALTRAEYIQLAILGIADLLILYGAYHLPLVVDFFTLNSNVPTMYDIGLVALVVAIFGGLQYFVARVFARREVHAHHYAP